MKVEDALIPCDLSYIPSDDEYDFFVVFNQRVLQEIKEKKEKGINTDTLVLIHCKIVEVLNRYEDAVNRPSNPIEAYFQKHREENRRNALRGIKPRGSLF